MSKEKFKLQKDPNIILVKQDTELNIQMKIEEDQLITRFSVSIVKRKWSREIFLCFCSRKHVSKIYNFILNVL